MKVLITGGAGFIGSNLVHLLAKNRPEWKLHILDALTYAGNLENIVTLLDSAVLDSKRAVFHHIDINNTEAVEELFAKENFDLVFHLAAESHVDRSINSAIEFIRTNVLGTENLLSASLHSHTKRNPIKKFVHISTDEVYGTLDETGVFYETTHLDPTSPYAASKASSDLVALAYQKTHKLPVVVTRCTNNYGPYQFPEKFIPLFISNALEDKQLPLYGDGSNVRSWLHVRDHAQALLAVAEKGRVGEIYNIGPDSSDEYSNKQVAEIMLNILGKPASLIKLVTDRLAHDKRYAVDITKISNELGWKPEILFKDGIKETISWYLDNKSWWEKIKSGAYRDYYRQNYEYRGV